MWDPIFVIALRITRESSVNNLTALFHVKTEESALHTITSSNVPAFITSLETYAKCVSL